MLYFIRVSLFLAIIMMGAGCIPSPNVEASKPPIIEGFVGQTPTQAASGVTVRLVNAETGKVADVATTNFFGKYVFSAIQPGYYFVQVGKIKREVMIKNISDEKRLDIDLSAKEGVMDYTKDVQLTRPAQAPSATGTNNGSKQPNGHNNNQTAGLIAGQWWGYSGSTERKIGLCPSGVYVDYTESSYSGSSYNSLGDQTMNWGNASQQSGQGRWSVQGTPDNGTIFVQYNNGESRQLNYRRYDSNCLKINGNVLCKQSSTCR